MTSRAALAAPEPQRRAAPPTRAPAAGAGSSALASALQLARAGLRPSAALARVLVNGLGQPLTAEQVNELRRRYPRQSAAIDEHQAEQAAYTVTELRTSAKLTPYQPPTIDFRPFLPAGYLPTSMAPPPREAGARAGNAVHYKRQEMPASRTQEAAALQPTGITYHGAERIRGGSGLAEAGLHRTHHLSDSAVRALLRNVVKRGAQRRRVVAEWLKAVAGPQLGAELHARLVRLADADVAGQQELAGRLSNSPNNVGLGAAGPNMSVGARFDEARTASGIPSPVASAIAHFTQQLAVFEAADPLLVASALAQLEHVRTGETLRSMTIDVEHGRSAHLPGGPAAGPWPAPAAAAALPAAPAPAPGISLVDFIGLGPGDRPPVPAGSHPVEALNVYQCVALLLLCRSREAERLLQLVRDDRTNELYDALRDARFEVGAAGSVSLTLRP